LKKVRGKRKRRQEKGNQKSEQLDGEKKKKRHIAAHKTDETKGACAMKEF